MLKIIAHKSFSILLAVLVLFSTLSLTVEKHFCGSNLVDVALFTSVKKCGNHNKSKASNRLEVKKKSCCKDVSQVFSGQNQLDVKSPLDLSQFQKQFVAAYFETYINLFQGLPKLVQPFVDYQPPVIVEDIQVLDQVFLI